MQGSGRTDVGQRRGHNEDYFLADAELGLWLVCDGMGGHACGEIASRLAADTIRERFWTDLPTLGARDPKSTLPMLMTRAVEEASHRIFVQAQQDPAKAGMGTTCTVLLVHGNLGIVGHVGDSRLYILRGGQVHQLSEDHTYIAETVRLGLMTREEAKQTIPTNVLTRAVGPQPTVRVDTMVFEILPSDTFLLCSDGLTQYLDDESSLARTLGGEDMATTVDQLVSYANGRGGSDNITALVLRALPPTRRAEEAIARATQVNVEFQWLRSMNLLQELTMAELVRVASRLGQASFNAGEVVIQEGEISNTLYLLTAGEAMVARAGRDLAILKAGSHFGEMALLSRRPRSASVTATEPTRALVLSREGLEQILQDDPVAGAKVLWQLAHTLSIRLDEAQLERKPTTLKYEEGAFPSPFARRR